jgi:hypothetical protein
MRRAPLVVEPAVALADEELPIMVSVFLIERGPPAEFFSLPLEAFTTNAYAATRYPDRLAAERAILFLGLYGQARAVSHGFYDETLSCICYPNMCPLGCEPACPRCS